MAADLLVNGIRVAEEVRVGQEAVIQATVDPVCWFRFWVAIFTGVVVAVAAGIAVMAETVELEEEAVGRSIPPPEEPG